MKTNLAEIAPEPYEELFFVSVDFFKNPDAKRLLDVLVSILSEEYIRTAKENPDIFSD